jgi:hypothetical protein
VSWSWAALTSLNNAAWISYFALARYWTTLVPSISAVLLAWTFADARPDPLGPQTGTSGRRQPGIRRRAAQRLSFAC